MPEYVASCNIRLFRYSGEPNRRIKSSYMSNFDGTILGIDGDYKAGTFRTPLDFVHPTFYIESDKGFPWNYLRLQNTAGDYNVTYRYYFITKVTCINYNMYEVECVEDVLTTFGDIIYAYGYGMVDRNEFTYNDYIPDKRRIAMLGQDVEDVLIHNCVFNSSTGSQAGTGVWVVSGMYVGHETKEE